MRGATGDVIGIGLKDKSEEQKNLGERNVVDVTTNTPYLSKYSKGKFFRKLPQSNVTIILS